MKELNQYIIEKLRINKDINKIEYYYHPKTKNELISLLEKLNLILMVQTLVFIVLIIKQKK